MSYAEGNRFLYLETPLGADKLLLQSFTGTEGLSRLFDFQLDLIAENKTPVNFDTLIGQKVSFGIQGSTKSLGTRHFNGIVVELSQGARDREFTEYRMRIVPDIWKLTRKFQSRIFQHLSVPDILKHVLTGFDVHYQIQGKFEPRDYCTQYRETDFNFLSRMMEEEGIYYFFKFTHGAHQLVLANTPGSHPDIHNPKLIFDPVSGGGRDEERITKWHKEQYWGSGKVTTWDHHFQLPHKKLQGQEMSGITVAAGKISHKLSLAGNDALEIYDYPAAYAQRFDGINKSGGEQAAELQKIFPDAKRSVGIWMQQQETGMLRIQAVSHCRHITAGNKFTLQRHFNGDGQYTITQVSHAGAEGDFRSAQSAGNSHYSNSFECIPFALPFRPSESAKRPLIEGPQTAVVVGPAGEEIFTDKYGRVKVQFHWDRDGKYDGDSSCWLRVATLWAGKQWGSVFIPRIGHEVIVAFIEGDPDRPVIVGSVYNADTMPPYEQPPNKTRSGAKSDSSMGSGGFNEIRFEDLKGKEQVFIHGQMDSDTRIENDAREWIGRDRHLIVKRDKYKEVDRDVHFDTRRDHLEKITRDRHVTVQGKEAIQVTGTQSLQVTGNVAEQFGANHTEATTASYFLQAQSLVLEAEMSISLAVGGNFISILPAGIFINGMPLVNINSGGAPIPGIPGMPVSPTAPGTAIEADNAIPGSEVTYSADGAPSSASSAAAGAAAPSSDAPKAGDTPAAPKIPKDCPYLDKPYTVESTKENFDRIRKPAKLSKPKDIKHKFPGDTNEQDALEYEVEVDGKKKKLIMPKNPPKDKNLPTAQQMADAMGAVPGPQLDKINQVVVSPNKNPDDAYWAKEYKKPDFSSVATGGTSGVTFYPRKTPWSQEFADSTMIHEGGHTYSQNLWSDDDTKKAWEKAMKDDGKSPSTYADSSTGEDFSESLVMYSLSKGTPCEATAKALYPNRYKALDKLFGAKT